MNETMTSESNETEFLLKKINELCYELEIKSCILEKLTNENQMLKEKHQILSDELFEEKTLRLKYTNWYMNIANSTFWKLTKPLRVICDYIKKKYN